MTVGVSRFSFSPDVPLDEAEMTLQLATFAVEGLFGPAQVRLEFGYHIEPESRVIVIDGSKEVGSTVILVFTNLLLREFGEDSFHIERVNSREHQLEEAAA